MGISSSNLQPQELVIFKKLPTDVPFVDVDIPEKDENRRPTNVKWLIILGVFLLVLLPFMIYTLCYADIARIFPGYDKCGNICGKENSKWDGIACSGIDQTENPFLEYETRYTGPEFHEDIDDLLKERHCVSSCRKGYSPIFGTCLKKSTGNLLEAEEAEILQTFDVKDMDYALYFSSVKFQLIVSCLFSILVAMGMVFLFRYAIHVVVWGLLISCFVTLAISAVSTWVVYANTPSELQGDRKDENSVLLVLAIILTIFTAVLAMILIACRRKIKLVIMLYKETTKAVFDMPGLVAIPVVCVIILLVTTGLFVLLTTAMFSAGTLEKYRNDFYVYMWNVPMMIALVYNVLAFLWFSQFVTGIQYMVIAGAVSRWYFSRDKVLLRRPIRESITVTFKFHLGSVALGSLLITLFQVVKYIIVTLFKNNRLRICLEYCMRNIEMLLKFLSKNAYIVTAMHGQPFLRSGKRAAKLILQNASDIIAVNFIGDFVLGMAQVLIVIVTLLVSCAIYSMSPGSIYHTDFPSYIVIAVISAIVACLAFGVFETTVDTLFICYCEDNLLNDGMSRPYFMSRNLREFVEESKKIYGKK